MRLPPVVLLVISLTAVACTVSVQRTASQPETDGPLPTLMIEDDRHLIYAVMHATAEETAQALVEAATRFEALFGDRAPRIAAVIVEDVGDLSRFDFDAVTDQGIIPLPWPSDDALRAAVRRVAGPLASRADIPPRIIRHEACHMYLIGWVSAQLGYADPVVRLDERAADGPAYGDPLLPDWFDEAVATLCEPESMRAERLRQMEQSIERAIPLARFLQMDHPARTAQAGRQDGNRARVRITVERRRPGGVEELFYPQALSLGEFLIAHGGPQVLPRLAMAFMYGDGIEAVLRDDPHLPNGIDALEAAWLRWVRSEEAD